MNCLKSSRIPLERVVQSALSGTSVPFAFRCFYAAEVRDSNEVERRLHDAFQWNTA